MISVIVNVVIFSGVLRIAGSFLSISLFFYISVIIHILSIVFANSALVILFFLLFSIIKLILLCIFFPPFFPVDIYCMFRYYFYIVFSRNNYPE